MTPTSDPGRWAEICAEFDRVVKLDAGARAERLAALAAADPELRAALDELLEADTNAASWLGRIDTVFGTAGPLPPPGAGGAGDVLGLVGRTIAHFRVVEPLAAGGMGAVYRGVDTQLGRAVALKFPLPGQRLDPRMRERFLHEARAAATLDHPNICSIFEAGETEGGQLFLAMPLYEGETLKARIAREGPLPIPDALAFARQIARGLQAAHRAGIVHRDLKPANTIILPDGQLKILDFGIARMSEATLSAGGMLGTMPYMAPEQVRYEQVDARVDLWALGVLLYEMLTGQRPFDGSDDSAVARAILHADPPPPSAVRPGIGPEVDALVMELLAKKPAERPTSAEAVEPALAAVEATPAVRHRRRPRARLAGVPGRALALGATATLVLAAGGTTAWLLGTHDPSSSAEPRIVTVLPFEDVGGRDDYLALAVPDEISTQLSRLRAVAVPTTPSGIDPREAGTPTPGIARQLGAAAVVSGTVRRTADLIRLEVVVFDVLRNRRILAEAYTGPTPALSSLQHRATAEIVRALRLDLTDGERDALRQAPAASAEAYDLYLRGRAAQIRAAADDYNYPRLQPPAVASLRRAESYFARARETDPSFAPARARLALVHLALAPHGQGSTRVEQGRIEAEAALRIQPALPEGHEALARYWTIRGDRLNAIRELEKALLGRPNAPHLHVRRGETLRNLGRWEEAVSAFERASRLDPLNTAVHYQAALTYSRVRKYEEAIAHWDRVIAMDTAGDPFPRMIRGFNYLRLGNLDSLDAAIRRIPLGRDPGGMVTYGRHTTHRVMGRHAESLASLDSASGPVSSDQLIFLPIAVMRGQALDRLGDTAGARASYDRARSLLEDSVTAHPGDARMRIALGLTYAGLGRSADALREARAATAMVPLSESSPSATAFMGGALEIYAQLGEADAAFELIELLLAMPAGRELSVPLLRLDPVYDPLRADPRYDALIAGFSPN